MTGPEHYQEAENMLEIAKGMESGSDTERYNLAAAQVHATLAQAAATVSPDHVVANSWRGVAYTDGQRRPRSGSGINRR